MAISKEEIINAAIDQQIKYGVPASITLAQAQLESGMGTSSIAQRSNNLFGLKAYKVIIEAIPVSPTVFGIILYFCQGKDISPFTC